MTHKWKQGKSPIISTFSKVPQCSIAQTVPIASNEELDLHTVGGQHLALEMTRPFPEPLSDPVGATYFWKRWSHLGLAGQWHSCAPDMETSNVSNLPFWACFWGKNSGKKHPFCNNRSLRQWAWYVKSRTESKLIIKKGKRKKRQPRYFVGLYTPLICYARSPRPMPESQRDEKRALVRKKNNSSWKSKKCVPVPCFPGKLTNFCQRTLISINLEGPAPSQQQETSNIWFFMHGM